MELGNSLYNRVAQGQYPSVECWSGWKAGSDQGVCYKLNPSGGPADWPTAFNCCQSIGGKLLAYDYTYDAQNVLGTSASLYTDLHYSGSAWVDADGPVGTPNWVTSDPQTFVPALSCATADSTGTSGSQTYDGLDCATANDYVCQYGFPFSSNIDFYDQRGSSYFIASNPSDNYGPASVSPGTGKVDIYWTRTQNQIYDSLWDNTVVTNHFTLYGYVQQEGFGRSISYLQDQVTKHQLFVGALPPSKAPVACNVPFELNQGKVYIYDGEFTKWTANQILLPPAKFNEQNFYAKTIDSDRAHLHTLIVGCYGCNYTTNSGAVFVYETDPTTKSWSQSQYLTPSSGNLNLGKERVRIHDNLIAADSGSKVLLWTKPQDQKNIASISNSLIKTEDAKPQPLRWSQQQALTALTYTFTNFDIFDETIILSSTAVPVSSFVNVGAVFVLYPNTPEFGIVAKKPQPLQWSVHQILYPPTPAANVKFGNDVSIAANRMVVTSGSSTVYVYARRTRSGFWSLQQTFAQGSTVLQTVLEGSTIYSLVNTLGNALEVYDQARGWDCLVVSIEDHFGDGWDDALLTVRTPAGPTKDEFHPRCDLENPFQFRYCPASNDHEGIYSFSIPDAIKSKYYWEIVWRVYLESTGEWIVGNWDTIMDFEWDKSSGTFKTRKVTKPLSNNVTCESCKPRPTQKPSPILLRTRHLKDNDNHGGTVSPTISPAPTIAVSAGTVWQYFTVSTTGVDWFVDSHKSTSYYISDIKGHRLLSVGTFCSISAGTSKLCWEDLPDGEYVLRIGGALNPYSSQHSIKWCKSINPIPAKTQVVVKITDGDCQALSYLTRNQVCSSDLDFDTIVEVELFLLGITSQLTSSDIQQIAKAFNSIFKGFTSASIKSSILTSDGLDIVINAHLNNHASGYDLTDPTVVTQIESDMKIMFQNSERDIWAAMISTDGKSLLHSVSQVSFVSLNFVGTDSPPLTLDQIADEVVTFYPEIVVNKSETVSTLYSITGYIFVALSLILVTVFMAVRKATNNNIVTYSPIDIESKLTNENVNKNDNYSGNVSDADGYESENKEIQEKEVKNNKSSKKSTKKSKKKISSTSKGDNDINRVFAKDLPLQKLKELANAEDEYLSITSK